MLNYPSELNYLGESGDSKYVDLREWRGGNPEVGIGRKYAKTIGQV